MLAGRAPCDCCCRPVHRRDVLPQKTDEVMLGFRKFLCTCVISGTTGMAFSSVALKVQMGNHVIITPF